MGYTVDVLIEKSNVCKSKAQLLSVAQGLRVDLNASRLNLIKVVNDRSTLRPRGESQPMVCYAFYVAAPAGGRDAPRP